MDNEVIIKAKQLYDLKRYADSLNTGLAALKELTNSGQILTEAPEKKRELFLIICKSWLFIMPSPMDSKGNEAFLSYVRFAAKEATDIHSLNEMETDLLYTYEKWNDFSIRCSLAEFNNISNPTDIEEYQAIYKAYISTWTEYPMLKLRILNIFAETRKNKGFETINTESKATNTNEVDRYAIQLDVVKKAFENTREVFNNNCNANSEHAVFVAQKTYLELTFEALVLKISDKKSRNQYKELHPDIYLSILKLLAEIYDFHLSAISYPDGKALSLIVDNAQRNESIQELKDLYCEIKEIDPSFIIPPLPSAESIVQKSKSGCYIATAVYGSYDCPQVWTLRRYRDNTLAKTWFGRAFIRTYYFISPTLVKLFGKTNWFRLLWKPYLDKKVKRLHDLGVEDTPYNDKRR